IAAAATGLTMSADARYVVDPAKHRVRVAVGLSATNHRTDTKTRRFYYDRTYLAVQPGTSNFKIKSSGVSPTVRAQRRTSTYTLLRIDFGKQLAAGATRRFSLTFDIKDPGGAPTRTTRIGASLVSFAAWGFGSGGSPGSVSVQFPAGFSVDVDAPHLGKPVTDSAGTVSFTTGRLANPLAFFAYFVADRPNAYKETKIQVTIGDRTVPITIRAWPDDPAWAKRVARLLKRGLPALAADIGLPWTVERPLVVSEAISRTATGFAGRYNPPAGEIEIAYYATTFVILHEAAHAWFDGRLLADRWASEGFASYYAQRAAKKIGEKKVKGDVLTPALEKIRIPLNAWRPPGEGPTKVEDAEYAAALKVATLIGERAGAKGLTAVWQAIHQQRAAYQPTGPGANLETVAGAPDWRGFLDLLEERTVTDYGDLWGAWVIRPSEAHLLDERAAARQRYESTAQRADSWLLPRSVRDALRAWQFDQVAGLLDSATTSLADRETVAAAARDAGLTPPSTMATAFEGPRGFAAASAEAEVELAAIGAYREAAAARQPDPDLVVQVGLWNSDPLGALRKASDAFADGDLATAVQSAAYARKIWMTAAEVGRNRILAVGASLSAVLLATWLVLRWLRDRSIRRRSFVTGRG
ncbi:MAG: hypothetical protein H0V73_05155, partial [Chloroflexi bacterium]|nr:hypothetical protein [Chloroflexota bacterium]